MRSDGELGAGGGPTISGDVVFRRADEEFVLVKLSTNEIYTLNPTGARIVELVDEGGSLDEAVARLCDEYGEPEDVLRPQVEAFVDELRGLGFVVG